MKITIVRHSGHTLEIEDVETYYWDGDFLIVSKKDEKTYFKLSNIEFFNVMKDEIV